MQNTGTLIGEHIPPDTPSSQSPSIDTHLNVSVIHNVRNSEMSTEEILQLLILITEREHNEFFFLFLFVLKF